MVCAVLLGACGQSTSEPETVDDESSSGEAQTAVSEGGPQSSGDDVGSTGSTGSTSTTGSTSAEGSTADAGSSSSSGGPMDPDEGGGSQASQTPIAPGSLLVDARGIAQDPNGSGFAGPLSIFHDSSGATTAMPSSLSDRSSDEIEQQKICVYGEAAQAIDQDFATYWGVLLAWNVNGGAAADLSNSGGLAFELVNAEQNTIRFRVRDVMSGVYYCEDFTSGAIAVRWDELRRECWDPSNTDTFDPSTQTFVDVGWNVFTNPAAATPFDFCVGGLEVLAP